MAKKTEAVEKKKTLADLVFENLDLINKVEEGGEITDDLAFMLESGERALEEKIDNYVLFLKSLDRRVQALKDRKKELGSIIDQKVKTIENKKKEIKQYARNFLDKLDMTDARGDLFTAKVFNSKTVADVNVSLCEEKYRRYTIGELSSADYQLIRKLVHDTEELMRMQNDHDKVLMLQLLLTHLDNASIRVLSSDLPEGHPAIIYNIEQTVTVR